MIVIGIKEVDKQTLQKTLDDFSNEKGKSEIFSIVDNLQFNKGWIAIIVKSEQLNDETVQYFSKTLNTTAVGYENVDIISLEKVITYANGQLEDELNVIDFEIDEITGHFDNLEEQGDSFEDYSELSSVLNSYFQKIGFSPNASEILEKSVN